MLLKKKTVGFGDGIKGRVEKRKKVEKECGNMFRKECVVCLFCVYFYVINKGRKKKENILGVFEELERVKCLVNQI